MASYGARERAAIARDLDAERVPACPVCGTDLDVQPVAPPAAVSYVRHRVWVLCPECRRTGAVDVRRTP
ncbi:MAG TPA: hypothetical protein VK966_10225 [Longimicrobiales bacterium]|nr:hypothetical protein [Longimicrobiales bacterium]